MAHLTTKTNLSDHPGRVGRPRVSVRGKQLSEEQMTTTASAVIPAISLETSVTWSEDFALAKVLHYRMHPRMCPAWRRPDLTPACWRTTMYSTSEAKRNFSPSAE
jgi:hypothetical protein